MFPVKEKHDAKKNIEEPKNISELKPFLGLLNYCHRHFQGFADTLQPLRNLLRTRTRTRKNYLRKRIKSLIKQTF